MLHADPGWKKPCRSWPTVPGFTRSAARNHLLFVATEALHWTASIMEHLQRCFASNVVPHFPEHGPTRTNLHLHLPDADMCCQLFFFHQISLQPVSWPNDAGLTSSTLLLGDTTAGCYPRPLRKSPYSTPAMRIAVAAQVRPCARAFMNSEHRYT